MTNEKQQEKLIAKFKMPLYQITLEMAQLIINDNLRHTLTEKEIRRLYMTFFDNENIYLHIMDAVIEAAEDAINNTDGRWDEYDKTSKDDFAF